MIKNCSFVEFLDKYEAVEIPILQRDYAQGRLDLQNKELNRKGKIFIKVLFDHLCSNRRLSMDIIYGSIEIRNSAESNKETFIPLDGQQRLTTLWLLHWYLVQWEGKGAEYAPRLRKFTYATRSTAREFCKQLCDMGLGHDELAEPSKYFSQKMWFTSQYSYDPTVQAMLNMLDAIAKQYKEKNQTIPLERLEQLQFRSFDIGSYKLTDDLYIKMNGRGRQLSSIENLKANFLSYLKEQGHDFSNENSYDRKFDHEWADMAWGEDENNGFDTRYLRLFHRYFYNLWIMDSDQIADNVPEELKANFTGKEYAGFEPYKKILDKEEGRLERMVAFFDFLVSRDGLVYSKKLFNPWRGKKENAYPYLLDEGEISIENRIALYAMMLYIDNSSEGIDGESYKKWMRIVWNLIIDPNSRNYGGQKRYMDLLSYLAPHAADIEDFLRTNDVKEISKNKRLELEKKKLEYLDKYPNRRNALLKAEEEILCLQGQVGFLLEIEGEDKDFERFVELAVENITPKWSRCAEYLWPALISLLEEPLFPISDFHLSDYLSHTEHGSGIPYRLQDLLNRPHIAKALRELFKKCIEQEEDFETVCKNLCEGYGYNERLYWHYPLVKSGILDEAEQGRIYFRGEVEGICLQKRWRVTDNEWCGYWRLSESSPELRTL